MICSSDCTTPADKAHPLYGPYGLAPDFGASRNPTYKQGRTVELGDFIVISTEARNRAAARWKEMMEKDFDLYYTPGINSSSPDDAMEYAAYQLGQINHKLNRIIAALGSTS
jgi:hypothetical protein